MFTFLHAADIHLDSPLRGLERYEDAPVARIRKATRRALENLVDRAVADQVAFVIIAGDLYDGDWKDYNTGLFFVAQMRRLREAHVDVFLIEGNHDAASRITSSLPLPDNVYTFPTSKAATRHALDGEVALHGQGFATQKVTTELWRGYPAAEPGRCNIGVMHTSLSGRPGHEPYAPCSADDLRSKGYDYWALGHVHAREIVSDDPWIVFPGNVQGRHIREPGAKGCTLVTVVDRDEITVEPIDLDVLRWRLCEVDVEGAKTTDDVLGSVEQALAAAMDEADDRPLAVRVRLVGVCQVHERLHAAPERWVEQIRALATTVGGEDLWLEKVRFDTTRHHDVELALRRDDALGGLLRAIDGLEADDELLEKLGSSFDDLRKKLPPELLSGGDHLDPTDAACLREPFEGAKELLLARLLSAGDDEDGR